MGGLYLDIEEGKYKADGKFHKIPLSDEDRMSLKEQGVPELFTDNIDVWLPVYQTEKSEFADEFLELSLFFKAFRASYSEMICIFPCFCPYGYFTRESFCKMYLIIACHFIQEPSGSPFCFPCGMSIYIHCGTHVRVS